MAKAKIEFLWYKQGDEISEQDRIHISQWVAEGFVVDEQESSAASVKEEAETVIDKVKDVVEDLLDDGKLNDSNKKRGRPKKGKR